ncbi:MAG: PD40 domain-containing protein [Acidobacteria bacterium]|nr:PD40 domain-containing protein [Acidobacteriota bacterium]
MNRIGIGIALFSLLLCAGCSQPPGGAEGYKVAFVPSMKGQHGIVSMNSDTTGSKTLIDDKMAQVRFASWSPDGKRLAFYTVHSEDESILKKYRMINEYLLYVMDATGENQKRLLDFPVMDFGWAPDSRRLFFISAYESPDRDLPEVLNGTVRPLAYVYVFDTQSGALNRLPGSGRNCSASWSPDGARLAVGFGIGENCGIYLISSDGGRSERLTEGNTIDFRPVWSPDGRSIAYVAHPKNDADAEDSGVVVISADGARRRRVAKGRVSYVLWSPDGSMLLLQSANTASLIDPNGQKRVLLSAGSGSRSIANATFAPDGRRIIFCSNDDGVWRIYSMDLDGRNRKTITIRTSSSNFCLSPLLAHR